MIEGTDQGYTYYECEVCHKRHAVKDFIKECEKKHYEEHLKEKLAREYEEEMLAYDEELKGGKA